MCLQMEEPTVPSWLTWQLVQQKVVAALTGSVAVVRSGAVTLRASQFCAQTSALLYDAASSPSVSSVGNAVLSISINTATAAASLLGSALVVVGRVAWTHMDRAMQTFVAEVDRSREQEEAAATERTVQVEEANTQPLYDESDDDGTAAALENQTSA